MIIPLLLLLVASVFCGGRKASPTQNEVTKCGACNDTSCEVRENVKVRSLCADSLCVGGAPVVVGDDDPCTSDDWFEGRAAHAPIKDCCRIDENCLQWVPEQCTLTECVVATGATHGVCIHQRIEAPDCCKCDADCPDIPCKIKTCTLRDPAEGLFVKLHERSMTLITPLQIASLPGHCNYTDVPADQNCCATSADCVAEQPNTVGICDKSCECIFVTSTQFECTEDSQCQIDEAVNCKCSDKGKCFNNICDRGWCACKQDFEVDADEDGTCCRDDCDDNDPTVQQAILCPVGNLTELDPDMDDVYECGVWVEAVCNTTCPNGAVPIDPRDVQHSKHDWKRFFLAFNCDCCSAAPGPDELIFCGRDQNMNGFFERQNASSTTPCALEVCVPQANNSMNTSPKHGGRGHTETSLAVRDAQCDAFMEGFIFVPTDKRDEPCDDCDGTPIEPGVEQPQEPVDCAKIVNGESICSSTNIDQCCDNLIQRADASGSSLPASVRQFVDCCRRRRVDVDTCDINDPFYPIEFDKCECTQDILGPCFPPDGPEDWPTFEGKIQFTGPTVVIKCVFDKDHDGFFDCDHVKEICVRTPECVEKEDPEHGCDGRKNCGKEWKRSVGGSPWSGHGGGGDGGDGDGDWKEGGEKEWKDGEKKFNCHDYEHLDPTDLEHGPEDETKLCKLKFGDKFPVIGYQEALNSAYPDDVAHGDFDGTFCDCNDKEPSAHSVIVCLVDKDKDGMPNCPRFLEPATPNHPELRNRTAECKEVCAAKCGPGFLSPNDFKRPNGNPICRPRRPNGDCIQPNGYTEGGGQGSQILGIEIVDDEEEGDGVRKRAAPGSLEHLRETAEKHAWFGKRSAPLGGGKPSGGWKKEKEPRLDEHCRNGYCCALCDCCDTDCAAFEFRPRLSLNVGFEPLGSAVKTNCGDHNYMCDTFPLTGDGMNPKTLVYSLPFAACSAMLCKQDCANRGRTLYELTDKDEYRKFHNNIYTPVQDSDEPLDDHGSCEGPPGCDAHEGWIIDSQDGDGDADRKRNPPSGPKPPPETPDRPCPEACTKANTVRLEYEDPPPVPTNRTLVVQAMGSNPRRPFRFGDCSRFLEGCTRGNSPNGGGQTCVPDIEICVRIGA